MGNLDDFLVLDKSVKSSTLEDMLLSVFTPAAVVRSHRCAAYYFQHEKQKLQKKKQKELESRSVARAHVGGPFILTTHDGKPFSDKDMLGNRDFVYLGFTNCPYISPTELDKVGTIMKSLESKYGQIFQPIFISVDPAGDTPLQMATYLADFHPRIVGLLGDYEAVEAFGRNNTPEEVVGRLKEEVEEWKKEGRKV
ncbi:hypothetical protein BDN67DRAFT_1006393 [Paxillus ammoniavirescens]|nr:hypothetical protein BDN67DRAFT_1006393 [Paxillus ammoniavirescens]